MNKTDAQWLREIRDTIIYLNDEIKWGEKHKELRATVVAMAMSNMKELALQYYRQMHAERKMLEFKAKANAKAKEKARAKAQREAEAKREAAKKLRPRKRPRAGSNPELAKILENRKAKK